MNNYVIVNESGQFWDGHKWVNEYPYGIIYNWPARRVLKLAQSIPLAVKVIEHYGMDNEYSWAVKRTTGPDVHK